mmetsp:Transcript_62927/g.72199  ORF Transcript_62927/g.72199 Transcript_62927/m.72199 type:complete len:81 (+) Transcript_62927:63-305(+)
MDIWPNQHCKQGSHELSISFDCRKESRKENSFSVIVIIVTWIYRYIKRRKETILELTNKNINNNNNEENKREIESSAIGP